MYFKRAEVIYPAIALIILVVITIFSLQDWRSFRQASSDTAETRHILDTTEDLLAAVTNAETGQRGFLLTGEERYLEPYDAAVKILPGLMSTLDNLTQRYRTQYDRVSSLKMLIPEKLEEMKRSIQLRREEGFESALEVVRTSQGNQAMEQIREICGQIGKEEYAKLELRSSAASRHGQQTRVISTGGSALLVVFLLLSSGALSHAMIRRERAIAELSESKVQTEQIRDLLHTTLTSIADAVVATDLGGKITFINPVALDLAGWTEEEAIGQPIEAVCRLVEGDEETPLGSLVQRALRDNPAAGPEPQIHLIARDGRRIPVDERSTPLRDGRSKTIGAVLVFRDVTARRQAENALVRSNEDLQQFAYAASHDLKTPLRTVTNFAQLLGSRYRGRLDPDADEFIGFIVDAARQMGQLLDALLDYSRSGEVTEKPRPLHADEVLDSALANLRAEIEETGAEITHGSLPSLVVDELHLRQLFQNLVGNAIKYRSSEAPKVHVSATRHGAEWTFAVRDNGLGIEPRHHSRIFGVFKRLHGPEYPGTGIGLATCRRIVERCGGHIWVESEVGRGSTFHFTLPVNARQPLTAATRA